MLFALLFQEPMIFFAWALAILFALSVHEFSHAYAAYKLGDDTAKSLGRLTLNPLAHVDALGFLMLLLIGFGWGKPVPFNPYNLKNVRLGSALISLAGPLSNLISAVIVGIVFKIMYSPLNPLELFFNSFGEINLLAIFLSFLIIINVILMIFNLIPIPPLDGSKVLFSILPDKYNEFKISLERTGPMLLLFMIILDNLLGVGIFSRFFSWILNFIEMLF